MQDIESTNLCNTCRKQLECFVKGIFKRETCDYYTPLSLDELAQRDKLVNAIMVGTCPKCGSENTYDCDNPMELIINDSMVGHCLDCGIYWCLECGYIFREVKKGRSCPHWGFCATCGYMDQSEFMNQICPTCEYYDNGCQLEKPAECEKEKQFCCPYGGNISECPEIIQFLERQD